MNAGFDTPIIIIARDRYECLVEQISWLENAGYGRIYIVDNNSTYDPLLDYYENTTHTVIRIDANLGCIAPWRVDLMSMLGIEGRYVVTDPDVVPDENCPANAIEYFSDVLDTYPHLNKVGFGLRIDDIPSHFKHHEEVINWESKFWQDEIEPGLFNADIDTTFALYHRHSSNIQGPAIRTGSPYLARHLGWYVNSKNPADDFIYYKDHLPKNEEGFSYSVWAQDELAPVYVVPE